MKQSIWEYYFLAALIAFFALFFIGTIEGSKELWPEWPHYFAFTTINLLISIVIGLKKRDN